MATRVLYALLAIGVVVGLTRAVEGDVEKGIWLVNVNATCIAMSVLPRGRSRFGRLLIAALVCSLLLGGGFGLRRLLFVEQTTLAIAVVLFHVSSLWFVVSNDLRSSAE